jgi:hypothetical protein
LNENTTAQSEDHEEDGKGRRTAEEEDEEEYNLRLVPFCNSKATAEIATLLFPQLHLLNGHFQNHMLAQFFAGKDYAAISRTFSLNPAQSNRIQ